MRRKVTFMQVEKTKQPLPENGHIFATMPAQNRAEPLQPGVEARHLPDLRAGLLASDRERRTGQAGLPRRKVRVQRVRVDRKGGGEPVSEYRAIYKCRLCGEEFYNAGTSCEDTASKATMYTVLESSGITPQFESRNAPIQFELHNCKDGRYGMADFQGMKKVGDSDG